MLHGIESLDDEEGQQNASSAEYDSMASIEEELRRSPLLGARIRSVRTPGCVEYQSPREDPFTRSLVEACVNGMAREIGTAKQQCRQQLVRYGLKAGPEGKPDLAWLERIVDCNQMHGERTVRDYLAADLEHLVARVGEVKAEQVSPGYLKDVVDSLALHHSKHHLQADAQT